jgi:hypothetical protein
MLLAQISLVVVMIKSRTYSSYEGRGFDSRWCHWNFSLTQSFQLHYGPGVDSASNRNYYQEYFLGGKGGRCIGLTALPPSCADCLEIWEPQPPGTLWACPGLYWDCFTFTVLTVLIFPVIFWTDTFKSVCYKLTDWFSLVWISVQEFSWGICWQFW